MLDIPFKNWDKILSEIDEEDVYHNGDDYVGLQKTPHITLLYPITDNLSDEKVQEIIKQIVKKKINIEIDKISIFESKDYDVLKFDVVYNEYLTEIHNFFKKNIKNKNEYPTYKPHITISHIKKGTAHKYTKDYSKTFKGLDNIFYTINTNKKIKIK